MPLPDNRGLPRQLPGSNADPAEPQKPGRETLQGVPATVLMTLLAARVGSALLRGCELALRSIFTLMTKLLPSLRREFGRAREFAARLPRFNAARSFPLHFRRPRIGVLLLALATALPAAYLLYCIVTLPFAAGPAERPNTGAFIVQTAEGKPVAIRGLYKGEEITPDHIPQPLAKAVIAIEDRRFYEHGGIDFYGVVRALWNNVNGGDLQGASTISQQLARLHYLAPERTLRRKIQEALLAIWLEWRLGKQEILAQYLNSAYFGYGSYGADAAANRYFSKSVANLSLSEAAMLAGLIRAPSALAPDKNLEGATQRAKLVLETMAATGAISQNEAKAAEEHPAQLRVAADAPAGSNYFIDTAVREARSLSPNGGIDLILRTTVDPNLQRLAENAIAKHIASAERPKNVHQAALVAMTRDGAILAMVGGRDYKASQFNRVTQAKRQPGSLFKLFDYLAALRKGFGPDDTIVDRPISIGNWEPENYSGRYYGPVTLRQAFAHSLNSVAVQLSQTVGIDQVIETARRAGLRSDLPHTPSVALGAGSATLLEMTSAYAAVAANVDKIEPYTIREIKRVDRTIYTQQASTAAAADDARVHNEMLDLLEAPVREGTAKAAQLNIPMGGKTGTSQEYRDAWFVGFTPELVVGVWVGNDDNSPMNSVTGGSIPASIWHDFVAATKPAARPAETVSMGVRLEPPAAAVPRPDAGGSLSGKLKLRRDGSFELDGETIRLAGIDNLEQRLPRHIRRLLRHHAVSCTSDRQAGAYNCTLGDLDLNAVILLSRGEQPSAGELNGAEQNASAADDDSPPPARRRRSHHRLWFFHW